MSRLHIANCTKQNQHIYYRLDVMKNGEPEPIQRVNPAKKSPIIRPGRQIQLGGDLHINQITTVVDQLNRFNMAGTIDLGRLNGFVPYLFSIDTPITADQIRQVVAHNHRVLTNQGKDRREAAAVSAAHVVEQAAKGADDPADTKAYEVEIEQEDEVEDTGRLEEGFKLAKDLSQVPDKQRRGRPRKAV